MADPIQVEVTRGDVVEARAHGPRRRGAGRADRRRGRRPAAAHVPALVGEAAPGAAARPGATRPRRPRDRDRLRLAPGAARAARRGARAARGRARDRGRPRDRAPTRSPIEHNCSGQARGLPRRLPRARLRDRTATGSATHPLQRGAARARSPPRRRSTPTRCRSAIDGCGVPTFALPLDRCAHAFARLPRLDGGSRVVAAMRAHPEMLRGPVAADAMFVQGSRAGPRRAAPRVSSAPVRADGLGHRAQGRGRRLSCHSPCTCRVFATSSASTPASSASSPWKTAAASPSERFGRG